MKLKDFVIFNPKETLSKSKKYRKISMDQIKPFTRKIESNIFLKYSGGSKFRNGDTIFARITPCLENGKTSFVSSLDETEVAFGSTEFIIVRSKPSVSLPLFVYYLMVSRKIRDKAIISMTGSSGRERVQQIALDNIVISDYTIDYQQHIVNTIGSVDDLIENYNEQYNAILKIGLIKINSFNQTKIKKNLNSICSFKKGIEVGSNKYNIGSDNDLIRYIRVGDLLSKSNTFINKNDAKNNAIENDILLALDGAPGRNNIGISGAFSSGIYKIISDEQYKGLVFFEINSSLNQKIIKDMSQGTTILHASKSIPFLQTILCNDIELKEFYDLFNLLVNLKNKIDLLQKEKNLFLNKFFTNQ